MTDEGLVAVQLKKPFRDGTGSVEMNPLSLDLPSPATIGAVMTTLNGWEPSQGSHHNCCAGQEPRRSEPHGISADAHACHSSPPDKDAPARAASHRCKYIPWHQLIHSSDGVQTVTSSFP